MRLTALVCSGVLLLCIASGGQQKAVKPALYVKAFGVARVQDCAYEINALSRALKSFPFPRGWTIAIACTPVAWNTSLRLAGNPPTNSGFTSLAARISVFNGMIFHDLEFQYRRTITHELGHIRCHCEDEWKAEEAASQIEREAMRLQPAAPGTAEIAAETPR